MDGTSTAEAILRYWERIEVLTPARLPDVRGSQEPGSQELLDLPGLEDAGEESSQRVVAMRAGDGPPWPGPPPRADESGTRWVTRNTVYLGVHALHAVMNELCSRFGARDDVEPRGRPAAVCIAAFVLDDTGVPIPGTFALSSLAWAMGRLREDDYALEGFEAVRGQTAAEFDSRMLPRIEAGVELAAEDLQSILAETLDLIGWEPSCVDELARVHQWRARESTRGADGERAVQRVEAPLLSSFYLGDLARVRRSLETSEPGTVLAGFMSSRQSHDRVDVLAPSGRDALLEAISPERMPPARWPGREGTSLALMQQVAVDCVASLGETPGMVAINGPPGTGKTTLLRDVIAAVVVERAKALSRFDEPSSAFVRSTDRVPRRNDDVSPWLLDASLRGFELVVASSDNGAVENVTKEIPAADAVHAGFAAEVDYFAETATALLHADSGEPMEAWGLAAAVLGRMSNRRNFAETVWFDPRLGLKTVINREPPPDWDAVRTQFTAALDAEAEYRRRAGAWAAALRTHEASLAAAERARSVADVRRSERDQLREHLDHAQATALRDDRSLEHAKLHLESLRLARPFLLLRLLFFLERTKAWRQRFDLAITDHQDARAAAELAGAEVARLTADVAGAEAALREAESEVDSATRRAAEETRLVEEARSTLGDRLPDAQFWRLPAERREQLLPWLSPAHQQARAAVFAKALKLHRAFISAARRPVLDNLGVIADMLKGRVTAAHVPRSLPDLWATLFLVTAVVSTTFASMPRMFDGLGQESLGWLLLDEAGQAAPQHAVGALWRARRAVVIGDPLQVEPVVPLPADVTAALRRHAHVDPRWDPHMASAQTLADDVSRIGTLRAGRWVGCPLRVHRRCIEPMFSLSNRIAYDGTMILATPERECVLPVSRWVDTVGAATVEHWIPEQGDQLLEVLVSLTQSLPAGKFPDVFVVSPFRSVADQAEQVVARRFLPRGMRKADVRTWARDHVGTVHTFQGKEAEAVVFILGGNPAVPGALIWAGETPNIVNVAVTRARQRLYVIGDRALWSGVPLFRTLVEALSEG